MYSSARFNATGGSSHQAPLAAISTDDEIVVKVENLSKLYQLYDKPGDRLKQMLLPRIQGVLGREPTQYYRDFWALRDISFSVKRGETLGIIGRNGAGKSTLLQILCGTLTPSGGNVQIKGRVAALLELGSGFNPEFSGRENVFLNASVLGLTREQTAARFADILAFADIGEFIDQPVKTYSSGMMMRLAFAVISHVDADLLVIDEALAVGDAVFTQKCMRFLRGFMKKGTVLFVSHDTAAVMSLCNRAVWLRHGFVHQIGTPQEVSEAYLLANLQETYGEQTRLEVLEKEAEEDSIDPAGADSGSVEATFFDNIATASGWTTGKAEIEKVDLNDDQGRSIKIFKGGERINLKIHARSNEYLSSPIIGWFVKDRLGQSLFGEHTFTYVDRPLVLGPGERIEASFSFRLPMLPNGEYSITVSLAEGDLHTHVQHHWLHDAAILKVSSEKLRYGLVGIPFENVSLVKTGN